MNLPSIHDQVQQRHPEQLRVKAERAILKFNLEQQNIFNKIVKTLLRRMSCHNMDGSPGSLPADAKRFFFVDASGGTGKTFATSVLQWYIRLGGLKVLTVAYSAIAAHLLDCRRTAHSAIKIPFPVLHQITGSINVSFTLTEHLCNTSLFIWDEIVTTHRKI